MDGSLMNVVDIGFRIIVVVIILCVGGALRKVFFKRKSMKEGCVRDRNGFLWSSELRESGKVKSSSTRLKNEKFPRRDLFNEKASISIWQKKNNERRFKQQKSSRKQRTKMSYLLPHLNSGWAVDQAILQEEERIVVIRFGRDHDTTCMEMDETLSKIAELVKNMAVIYLVDLDQVGDFTEMYELYDPCTVMFFYRNKHIRVDLGTGNNNKINFAIDDKQEMIDMIETVYSGARKGKGQVTSPKDYSTKYKY